jgi:3-hydroxybutyryl-CoA dehydratase
MAAEISGARLAALFPVGASAHYRRHIEASDLKAFSDVTGDDDPIHWDVEFCRRTPYGRPIAQAVLLMGYLAAASVRLTGSSGVPLVSLGYDRIRIISPVFAGEDIDASFTVLEHDETRQRLVGAAELRAGDRLAVVGRHILKRVG